MGIVSVTAKSVPTYSPCNRLSTSAAENTIALCMCEVVWVVPLKPSTYLCECLVISHVGHDAQAEELKGLAVVAHTFRRLQQKKR
jgi:hypothetical protein